MIRNVLAVVAGLIAAYLVFMSVQYVSHLMSPVPADLDPTDPEAMKAFMATITPSMFLVVLGGYALGSFVAGILIRIIAGHAGLLPPMVVGIVLTLLWVMNIVVLPHPLWVALLGFLMFIPFVLIGHRLAKRN